MASRAWQAAMEFLNRSVEELDGGDDDDRQLDGTEDPEVTR